MPRQKDVLPKTELDENQGLPLPREIFQPQEEVDQSEAEDNRLDETEVATELLKQQARARRSRPQVKRARSARGLDQSKKSRVMMSRGSQRLAASAAKSVAKQATSQLTKQAIIVGARALLLSPYFWAAVGIILGLMLLIALILGIAGYVKNHPFEAVTGFPQALWVIINPAGLPTTPPPNAINPPAANPPPSTSPVSSQDTQDSGTPSGDATGPAGPPASPVAGPGF